MAVRCRRDCSAKLPFDVFGSQVPKFNQMLQQCFVKNVAFVLGHNIHYRKFEINILVIKCYIKQVLVIS